MHRILTELTGEEWKYFKEQTGNEHVVFYKVNMYDVKSHNGYNYLHFCGTDYLELPLNCSSCRRMFEDCKLTKQHAFINVNTCNIVDMDSMFKNCSLLDEFSLGDNFDTSNVIGMISMFENCKFPKYFTLGDKFNTSNVTDLSFMFACCTMSGDFDLGDMFSIDNADSI